MQRMVTIIILTWNGIEYTKRCLESLHVNTEYDNYEVIVVDNGSTDGTVEYLKSIPWIKPVFNKENLGFARANNIAIDMASPESDIILINNDVEIYDPVWIEKFQAAAYKDEQIGIVGCRIRRPTGMLQHAGTYMPDFTFWGQQTGSMEKDINQYNTDRDVEGVVFACVYIKSNVIRKIGKLNTDYFSYFEDTDYCLTAKNAGIRVVNCGSLTVLHHEHVSTTVNKVNQTEMFLKSQNKFKKKWQKFLEKRLNMNVCWHSTFSRPLGIGTNSRLLVLSLEDRGVGVSYQYLYGPGTVFPVKEEENTGNYRLNIVKRRKPRKDWPHIIYGQGDAFEYVKGCYRIGYTMLETTGVPKEWVRQANAMDEVWVPSPFNAWTFKSSGVNKPVCVMPIGLIDTNYFNPDIVGYPLKDIFTFLSIFEWGERKAPEILIKAFNQTFRIDEPVILICKYINYDGEVDVKAQIDAMKLDPQGGQIIFSVNQHVPYYQISQLYRSADCFVLPARGEGWGMPVLEAMACGLPVIAPYWSAQQTFMTDTNSYPVQVARLVDAKAKCPYYKGFKWAEPDIDHLKQLMRHVYENPEEAGAKGKQAVIDVQERWSLDLCGERMRERLEEIAKERSEGKKPSFQIRMPKGLFSPRIGFDISRGIGEQITGVGRYSLNFLKGFANLSQKENPFEFLLLPGLGDYVHPLYMKPFLYEGSLDKRFTLYRGPLPAFSCSDHYIPGLALVHSTAYMKPDTRDIPLVITVHDLTFLTHPEYHTGENIQFCKSNMSKAVKSNCHFIAVSENTKKDIIKHYKVDADRISVVYVPVDQSEFKLLPLRYRLDLLKKYNLPERFFLYVGSLEPRKNLKTVLEAMRFYKGTEPLVIIGAAGWKNSDIHAAFGKAGEKVRVMGYVHQSELPVFYNAALSTVYPSLYEGFGMPVVESMACGTPVITSNNSSIPEVAGNACILLKNPTDPKLIAEAMSELAEDESLRKSLAEKGIKQALEFSPENCARTALSVYAGLLGITFRPPDPAAPPPLLSPLMPMDALPHESGGG